MDSTSSTVTFLMGKQLVEIDFKRESHLRPTTTVLQYLRGLPDRKGTKEGCAEGDCGACTVSIGSLNTEGEIEYNAIDSCLVFLPMLQGKWLITVEDIGDSNQLHPVQQAMVDYDGSQCGYCTPGFVMSMFTLNKNHSSPNRETIDDALTGNLCRCTGYRSIVEATTKSCGQNGSDFIESMESQAIESLKSIRKSDLSISTADQQYFKPQTLVNALKLRTENPEALIVSGATDLALTVTKKHTWLPEILDIGGLSEMKQISEAEGTVNYGAGLSLEQVHVHSKSRLPALAKMLSVFGSLQIRNLATLGGNLCSASPIGDMAPVMMAYGASVVLQSENGQRELSVENFITGYRQTELRKDELMVAIKIPIPSPELVIDSFKVSKRKDLDISTVSAGFKLKLNDEEKVEEILLAYGGMAAMTKRAQNTESFLLGKTWNRDTIEQAKEFINEDFTPISDARSGKEARSVMASNLLLKFWAEQSYKVATTA